MALIVSFEKRNITLHPEGFSFARGHAMRFEWLALLAYARISQLAKAGWVQVEDIQQLPLWNGKSKQHVGTNVGRYMQHLQRCGVSLVEARTPWRGPYRVMAIPSEIKFDVPFNTIGERLGLSRISQNLNREELRRFVQRYARAASFFFKGQLISASARATQEKRLDAWHEFANLAADDSFEPALRLLANLGAVRTLDRLGKFKAAENTLLDCTPLIKQVNDTFLTIRFLLANSWCSHRAGNHDAAKNAFDAANAILSKSLDLSLIGATEDRHGLFLSNSGEYQEALRHLLQGLKARLFAENYDALQASTFNIGNTLHRMGEQYYLEANAWLTLSLNLCKWLHLGRDDALSEIILAKIAFESGQMRQFAKWLAEAEQRASQAHNILDQSTCLIVRALALQSRGKSNDVVDQLVKARHLYCNLRGYDWQNRDKYVRRKFPELWARVLGRFSRS